MKYLSLFFALLPCAAFAQYAGDYGTADTTLFQILQRTDGFYFSTGHYGNIRMVPLDAHRFTLDRVKPVITIEFDSSGRLLLHQSGTFTWIKDTPSAALTGLYHQDIDPSMRMLVHDSAGHLFADTTPLRLASGHRYKLVSNRVDDTYDFRPGRLVIHRTGVQVFLPRAASGPRLVQRMHAPDRHLGFSRADTLEGAPLPARTCYDVLFYDLDVAVNPVERTVRGSNRIRFRAVRDFDSLQLDLYANLRVDSIRFNGVALTYSRELNAVYVHFPFFVAADSVGELTISYHGAPIVPDPSVLQGGIIWFHDATGKPWAESVCQGSGGSLWWPGKDLLSDKPDSMRIALTVPHGLTGIANGRLVDSTDLPDGRCRFVWYVSYPILNYDVAFYIGDYVHWRDSVGYTYYCLPYSLGSARPLFAGVPAMMRLYEQDFGPYPFPRDGFKLVEGPYPMEHQSAVSLGPITPLDGSAFDTGETTRTMWHESAHEWWGNSVSCGDFADLWIHEAFATYAEQLAYVALKKGSPGYIRRDAPGLKEPIIGVYGVNYFYLGDMYSKGAQMLWALQHMVGDSVWFRALRGIQSRFRYGSVNTEEVVGCFDSFAGGDYTAFFDKYLRTTAAVPSSDLVGAP